MSTSIAVCQNSEYEQKINITPFIPEQIQDINATVRSNLLNKMSAMITRNGLATTNQYNRFVLTSSIDVIQKSVTNTAPPMHLIELNLNLHFGDGIDGILFASQDKLLKGLGKSETAAYLMAISALDPKSEDISTFLDLGKQKIVAYYESTCESTLQSSQSKAASGLYDEALFDLVQIPNVATSCYAKAIEASIVIYKGKLDKDCQINLANAKKEMSLGNWTEALNYIQFYDPGLSCHKEATKLVNEIGYKKCSADITMAKSAIASRDYENVAMHLTSASVHSSCKKESDRMISELSITITQAEKRAFQLAYERLKGEQNLKEQSLNLRKQEIQAIRDIGVAYAKSRPTNVTYNVRNW